MSTKRSPRMSITKLAEYLDATPHRRGTIIRDQKHPRAFKVANYNLVEPVVRDFVLRRGQDVDGLRAHVARWQAQNPRDDFHRQQLRLAAEATKALIELMDTFEIPAKLSIKPAPRVAPKLVVSGVTVSIRPDVLLLDKKRRRVGALKLYYGKTHPLTSDGRRPGSGSYAATMVHRWVEEHCQHLGKPAHSLCYVLDVFEKRAYVGPRAYISRRADVAAACREITDRWDRA